MKIISTLVLVLFCSLSYSQSENPITLDITETHIITSKILGEDREILVYFPKGFWGMDEDTKGMPLVIVLDGESQFLHTMSTVDHLSAAAIGNDFIPRSVVIGIVNTNRNRDLTPRKGMVTDEVSSKEGTGGGKKFLDFITKELIPYAEKNFYTSDHRTIIGHSLGGLTVFQALLEKRDYFKNYLAIDPGLGFDQESYMNTIIDSLSTCELEEEKLFLAMADNTPTFIGINDIEKDSSELLRRLMKPTKKFIEQSIPLKWSIDFDSKYYPRENHFSIPLTATYDAFKIFYDFYPFPEMMDYYHPSFNDRADLVDRLKEHFDHVSSRMDSDQKPMQSYINSFAFGLGHYGRNDLAEEMLKYNMELYPEHASSYSNIGYFFHNNGNTKKAISYFEKSLSLKEDEALKDFVKSLLID